MSDSAALGSGLTHHASQLARTFAKILGACGFSSGEIHRLMEDATVGLRADSVARRVGGSVDDHLACTDVVFVWRQDPRFLDEDGKPRKLELTGPVGSFEDLVRSAAPSHKSALVLDYLVSLGAIRCLADGSYVLITESVLACSGTDGGRLAAEVVLLHLLGFLGSVEYNLREKRANDVGKFERACYSRIPADLAPIFEKLVEERGQNFVDGVDEWLVRHRTESLDSPGSVLAGAGAYVFARSMTAGRCDG